MALPGVAPVVTTVVIVIVSAMVAKASEICVYKDRYKICDHGCCSNDCCMSPYQIAGIVFGVLALICIIAAITLYCVKRHKRKSRVVGDSQHQTRVVMVNGYSQPMAYTTTQPFAPGYAATYGHPGVPPPYSAQPMMPHPPPQYGMGGAAGFPLHPPPAYTGSDAAKNPFATAAFSASAANPAQGASSTVGAGLGSGSVNPSGT